MVTVVNNDVHLKITKRVDQVKSDFKKIWTVCYYSYKLKTCKRILYIVYGYIFML